MTAMKEMDKSTFNAMHDREFAESAGKTASTLTNLERSRLGVAPDAEIDVFWHRSDPTMFFPFEGTKYVGFVVR